MPVLSRFLIKASLVYLVLGVLGSALTPWTTLAALRLPLYHLIFVGWLTQLVFGVAYWLFPRHSRERPYGRDGLLPGAAVALNIGLLLRVTAEQMVRLDPGIVWRTGVFLSALLQVAAVVVFAAYFWTRVKAK